ncbi:VPLPA-CTERM-specific exosortase XrtD [Sulfurifustis variabilis]|uniref:VPLPA-CTERM-specific exosortase XrtD n=1 Tax=Sulfurifustis variabilis TaxID=1675686 RepID=UPI0018D5154E|nr:VPLPA-CTERM-specific exosortase XrtD [Sulfurifustis variabilis]
MAAALLGFTFQHGIAELLRVWEIKEEYSFGYLIPFITLFLVWQRKDRLESVPFTGSWAGFALVLFGLLVYVAGELSTLYLLIQYALLLALAGLVLAFTGPAAFRVILVPLLLLVFMVPLPQFFLSEISQHLQLISSQIGVAFIRIFGISVFLEGNVIDLGTMKLQVVEACSGLRYLFPLMTLGFICAYFFSAPFWKRAFVFLSTIPITVLMNSLRIGIIGILVEFWGESQAEGFLHDFEGWIVFMACTAVLVGEMWLLNRFGQARRPWREAFGLELPAATPKDAPVHYRSLPVPYLAVLVLLLSTAVLSFLLPQRVEATPAREDLISFPLLLGEWQGVSDRIEQIYLNELKLDDYLIVNYAKPNQPPVNLYIAYYGSQRKGQSAHSPRTCMPGGGWRIADLEQASIDTDIFAGQLPINRALIQLGDRRQLVYYWFQQRGRVLTNEYLVKWFIFWDAITRNRTDGGLVRVVTPVLPGEDMKEADQRLASLVRHISPLLARYLPD